MLAFHGNKRARPRRGVKGDSLSPHAERTEHKEMRTPIPSISGAKLWLQSVWSVLLLQMLQNRAAHASVTIFLLAGVLKSPLLGGQMASCRFRLAFWLTCAWPRDFLFPKKACPISSHMTCLWRRVPPPPSSLKVFLVVRKSSNTDPNT